MSDDGQLGYLLHGFEKDEADVVKEFMESLAGQGIIAMSATGLENKRVLDILDSAPYSDFAAADPKVFMFLGFDDAQISAVMKHFPIRPKPIFCTPTEQNMNWTFDYLVEHLLEERAFFTKK